MTSENILKTAIKQAKKNTQSKFKHGCVIYDHRGIISIGFNRRHPSSKCYNGCRTLHAEVDAIKRARVRLKGATMIVIRTSKTKLSNSKPCEKCMEVIKKSKIKIIYYSDEDGYLRWMMV